MQLLRCASVCKRRRCDVFHPLLCRRPDKSLCSNTRAEAQSTQSLRVVSVNGFGAFNRSCYWAGLPSIAWWKNENELLYLNWGLPSVHRSAYAREVPRKSWKSFLARGVLGGKRASTVIFLRISRYPPSYNDSSPSPLLLKNVPQLMINSVILVAVLLFSLCHFRPVDRLAVSRPSDEVTPSLSGKRLG